MTYKIDLTGSMVLTTAQKISVICKPLRSLEILGFQYMKRFKDGSRIILCNRPELMKYFYEEGLYPLGWYDNDKPISIYQSGWEFWPIKALYNNQAQKLTDDNLEKLFNVTQSVTCIEKCNEFIEFYRFFSDNKSIYSIQKRLLQHFIFYFKEQAANFFKTARQEKIFVPLCQEILKIDKSEEQENEFFSSINVNKYYIDSFSKKNYLTNRELNCLTLFVNGKTAEEISILLNIEKRTVENHAHNIKEKFNCYKQSQLVISAIKHGLINI